MSVSSSDYCLESSKGGASTVTDLSAPNWLAEKDDDSLDIAVSLFLYFWRLNSFSEIKLMKSTL